MAAIRGCITPLALDQVPTVLYLLVPAAQEARRIRPREVIALCGSMPHMCCLHSLESPRSHQHPPISPLVVVEGVDTVNRVVDADSMKCAVQGPTYTQKSGVGV
jgi:hypothetical protein